MFSCVSECERLPTESEDAVVVGFDFKSQQLLMMRIIIIIIK